MTINLTVCFCDCCGKKVEKEKMNYIGIKDNMGDLIWLDLKRNQLEWEICQECTNKICEDFQRREIVTEKAYEKLVKTIEMRC